ncbi:MAG: hypothetical protein RIR00_1810 [Pseudomonadota bacterium]|jgi:hypothetical protein
MNEEQMARRLSRRLNQGLPDLDDRTTRKLAHARKLALARQRPASTSRLVTTLGGLQDYLFSPRRRLLLSGIALLIGMAISFYWHAQSVIDDMEDVDSALLSDDIPPEAFLDKGFKAWLDSSSQR